MFKVFGPLRKTFFVLEYGGLLVVVFVLVHFLWHQLNIFFESGVRNDEFVLELITLAVTALVFYVFYISVSTIALVFIGDKKYNNLTNKTMNSCKAKEFINISEGFKKQIENHPKRFKRNEIMLILINLLAGYVNGGKYQSARAILDEFPEFKNRSIDKMLKPVYFFNCCSYYIGIGDLDQAKLCLEKGNIANRLNTRYKDMYILKKLEISLLEGNYKDAEPILKAHLENSKTLMQRVYCHFLLSKVYSQENRPEEALASLEFVIKNGGDTYMVPLAQDAIERNSGGKEN